MKKAVITSVILIVFFIGYVYFLHNPIFIGNKKPCSFRDSHSSNYLLNPIENIDFTCGNNKIIIYFDRYDVNCLPAGIKQNPLLFCTNNTIIQQIKEHFEFKWNGEDYAETTEGDSKIYFFKDNKVVFQCPFHFEGNISIHFKKTGWIFSANYEILKENFMKFKPMYNPIVILR
jgi:hypothetical protein